MSHATAPASPPASPAPPPGPALYQIAIGHFFSHALYAAAKLDLAELMKEGPRDVNDLAAATGTQSSALRRLMRLLASAGVFEETPDGRFGLTPMGALLRGDVPGSMQAMVKLFTGPGIQDNWKDLEYCVRTGEPAFRRHSPAADPFSLIAQDPQEAANFDKAMATFAPQTAAAVASAYDFSPFKTVADVGGGNGAILVGLLRANPHLRGIVFDQPHVAERAREHVAAEGLAGRCQVIAGDFFEGVAPGADVYLLKHVIHDWNDAQATAILKNVRAQVPAAGRLLVVEGVYPPRIDPSPEIRSALATDVNMLVCTGGRQRSDAEFRQLFAAAGFRLTRIIPTTARVSVIEG
jgi:hypothetical protein